MLMENKKLVLIDAMSLAYKAYFAFLKRPLLTKSGEPTSAVYGFVNQLLKILEDIKPTHIAVAFDSKEKTFRHEKFIEYKAKRAEMPEDMIPQLQRIKDIITSFNIPLYLKPGYEADDIIGTISKKAEKENFEVFPITPDKDYIQLISDKIKLIKPGKTADELEIFTKEKVLNNYSFEPIYFIDYLALVGDQSDNIPGVKKIGDKTALPLIQKFHTIENIYEHIDEIESALLKDRLLTDKENAFISKELVTLNNDVPIDINFDEMKFKEPNLNEIQKIFDELEFKTLFIRVKKSFKNEVESKNEQDIINQFVNGEEKSEEDFLPTQSYNTINTKTINYHLISQGKDAKNLADKLKTTDLFVFDTETNSLNIFEASLVGVSFCIKEKEAYFIAINPLKKSESSGDNLFTKSFDDRLSLEIFKKIFKPIFESNKIKKVCQNGKFDIAILRTQGIEVNNFYFDTMIASYVLDPDQKHGMDDLAQKYLHYKPIALSELIGIKKDPSKIFDVNINELSQYSAEDADITFQLYKILSKEIEQNNLSQLCYDVEFPLVQVLEDMERTGIRIDKANLNSLSKDLQILMDEYTRNIYNLAGENFNINSPQQLQKILYNKLKLNASKKTKTGFSTSASALEELKGQHQIIDLILDYRTVAKLKSTYTDSLPKLINPRTNKIHTSFNQTGTSTGRLSSNDPNLQNIPIRTDLGKEIRKAFIPSNKDYVILSADYSQIELRILASVSNDENLIAAFKRGEDIHRTTASLVFKVKPEEVNADMRRKAKEVNFGILYGIGPYGLKIRLGINQAEAKNIIDNYFNTFNKVKSYIDSSKQLAKEKGYAETLLGRRRFLKNINSSNSAVRQFEERAAINMPIQGTAADMIKIAMNKIFSELTKRKLKTKMVLQVHDELLFDTHKDEVDEIKSLVKKIMENALPLNVPILVDVGIGDNWLDAH